MAKNVSAGVQPAEKRARGRSVWLEPEMYERLRSVARRDRRSASAQLCFVLSNYLKNAEAADAPGGGK